MKCNEWNLPILHFSEDCTLKIKFITEMERKQQSSSTHQNKWTCIYGTFHPTDAEHAIFFSSGRGTFSRIDDNTGPRTSFSNFKQLKSYYEFSEIIILQSNKSKCPRRHVNARRLSNMLLKMQWFIEENN